MCVLIYATFYSLFPNKMKPAIPSPPLLPKWLEDISSHLLNSTLLINKFNEEDNSVPVDETSTIG